MRLYIELLTLAVIATLRCAAEVFTAMADMELILGAEKTVTSVIDAYVESEQRRLKALQQFAKEYEQRNVAALTLGVDYISNPVNAYLLIKRLTSDWSQVERLMRNNMADDFLANITTQREMVTTTKFPTNEDLNGAATALMRLQDTYRLDTRDIANGKIKGARQADSMDGHACFELARTAYNAGDYYHTLLWAQEALNRIEHETPKSIHESEVLEYLAFSLYQQGNVKRALAMTKKLAQLDPDHPRAQGNVKWYEDMLKEEGQNPRDLSDMPPITNPRNVDSGVPERDDYEKLCRNEGIQSPKQDAKLYCYYKRDRPYLLVAPAKVEIVNLNPMAVLFHDMLSEHEMTVIKELATPRLKRATVHNRATGQLETANYRISKSAWLKDEDHPICQRVNRRIEQFTNLNMDTAEDLQIANYGLGGHYDVHFDHARVANYGLGGHYDVHFDMSTKEEVNAFKGLGTGNRIATILTYMSNVEAGGATVFPLLNRAVFPVKGAALFWYNLYRDGEGDPRTRHAACPVLAGHKWVTNKWIHERGQEFRRPCNLKPGEYYNENYVAELHNYKTRYNDFLYR